MEYLLGMDVGTSGTKTVLFDTQGGVVASKTVEYPMMQPRNGWAEQNPNDWWRAVREGIRAVLAAGGIQASEIRGIGLTGQMHSLVLLDAAGEVLRPAILWCDQRTAVECGEIYDAVGRERYLEITANPALTGFTAGKVLWVRKHEPEIFAKCRHILLAKDYIRLKLTGEYATDVSDASGMGLLDVPHRCWSDEVLEKLEIPRDMLARVYESPEITGTVGARAAAETGLSAGTPVVGGAGDNAAAAIGTGVAQDGSAFVTIGTSGVVFAHTSRLLMDPKGRVHTFCCAVPGEWHVMGVTLAAGASLQWFRNQCCGDLMEEARRRGIDTYMLMDRIAEQVPIGANHLLFLPYLMGERTPHLDPEARGAFFGLSSVHGRPEMIRAILEGVSYSLRDCTEVLREIGVRSERLFACGGGGTSPLWRQMLADVLQCPVQTTVSREGPALGAALLAGVGTGLYPSVPAACARIVRTQGEPQQPVPRHVKRYTGVYAVYRALYPALKDSYHALAGL